MIERNDIAFRGILCIERDFDSIDDNSYSSDIDSSDCENTDGFINGPYETDFDNGYDNTDSDIDENYCSELDYITHYDIIKMIKQYMLSEHGHCITISNHLPIDGLRTLFYNTNHSINYVIISEYVEDELGKYYEYHMYIYTKVPTKLEPFTLGLLEHAVCEPVNKNIIEIINSWENGPIHDWEIIEARQRPNITVNRT
jgi:hypothetical protein